MRFSFMKCGLATALLSALAGTVSAQPIRADLLVNEKLEGTKTFCLSLAATKPETSILIHAGFPAVSSGYFELNGKRVLRWRNAQPKAEQSFQTSVKPGAMQVTIGVDSEIQVDYFNVIGWVQGGVTEIKEVACPAQPPPPSPGKKGQ